MAKTDQMKTDLQGQQGDCLSGAPPLLGLCTSEKNDSFCFCSGGLRGLLTKVELRWASGYQKGLASNLRRVKKPFILGKEDYRSYTCNGKSLYKKLNSTER